MSNERHIVYPSEPVFSMEMDDAGGLLLLIDGFDDWLYCTTGNFVAGMKHPIKVAAIDLTMSTAKGIRLFSSITTGVRLVGGPWDGERQQDREDDTNA